MAPPRQGVRTHDRGSHECSPGSDTSPPQSNSPAPPASCSREGGRGDAECGPGSGALEGCWAAPASSDAATAGTGGPHLRRTVLGAAHSPARPCSSGTRVCRGGAPRDPAHPPTTGQPLAKGVASDVSRLVRPASQRAHPAAHSSTQSDSCRGRRQDRQVMAARDRCSSQLRRTSHTWRTGAQRHLPQAGPQAQHPRLQATAQLHLTAGPALQRQAHPLERRLLWLPQSPSTPSRTQMTPVGPHNKPPKPFCTATSAAPPVSRTAACCAGAHLHLH